MVTRTARRCERPVLKRTVLIFCAILVMACVPQEQVIPPDPLAPFPLRNTVIVGQPQPGVLLVEERSIIVNRARVRRAANTWCDGPASATALSDDRGDSALRIVSMTWLVRCQ